jgi:hypothetical protein
MVSTIDDATARKSDTDQRVGRTLWPASILPPFFSSETFSLTRGALHAEEKRPLFSFYSTARFNNSSGRVT